MSLKSSFILFLKSGMSTKWHMSGVVQGGVDSGREQPHRPFTAGTVLLFAAFLLRMG